MFLKDDCIEKRFLTSKRGLDNETIWDKWEYRIHLGYILEAVAMGLMVVLAF